MTSPSFEIQTAARTAILADATLRSLMGNPVPVFDDVPERQPMPYIVQDEPDNNEWDVTPTEDDAGFGKEHSLMFHVWSSYEGAKEMDAILRRLEEIFRDWAPSLTGHRLINIRFQLSTRFREPDLQARHGVIQFRAVTEEM